MRHFHSKVVSFLSVILDLLWKRRYWSWFGVDVMQLLMSRFLLFHFSLDLPLLLFLTKRYNYSSRCFSCRLHCFAATGGLIYCYIWLKRFRHTLFLQTAPTTSLKTHLSWYHQDLWGYGSYKDIVDGKFCISC